MFPQPLSGHGLAALMDGGISLPFLLKSQPLSKEQRGTYAGFPLCPGLCQQVKQKRPFMSFLGGKGSREQLNPAPVWSGRGPEMKGGPLTSSEYIHCPGLVSEVIFLGLQKAGHSASPLTGHGVGWRVAHMASGWCRGREGSRLILVSMHRREQGEPPAHGWQPLRLEKSRFSTK